MRENRARIDEVFASADKDKGRGLSRFELGDLLQRLGVPFAYDTTKVAALMKAVDTDNNGACTFSELKAAVERYRRTAGTGGRK